MAAMLKKLLTVCSVALLMLACYAGAQELRTDHPDRYVVQKGDTLWDIAAKFLQKPWLWPEIWHANPHIGNPHAIYPGDVLSLAYLRGEPQLQVERGPEVRPSEAIPTIPLAEVEQFLRDLRVLDSLEGLPYVVGLEEDSMHASAGMLIYARGIEGAKPGDMYAVVRPTVRYSRSEQLGKRSEVRAQDLDFRGDLYRGLNWSFIWKDFMVGKGWQPDILGYEVMTQGVAQVTQGGDPASLLLMNEGRDVGEGDLLLPLLPQAYDLEFVPRAPERVPERGARVLAVADGLWAGGPRSVVALSVGTQDGIANGHVLSMWWDGKRKPDRVAHRNALAAASDKFDMPDEFSGHVMIFRTFDKVSYGLVMNGVRPARPGDVLKMPDVYF